MFVGSLAVIVFLMFHVINCTEYDVVMVVSAINVSRNDITVLILQQPVRKLYPYLMGCVKIHLARCKGLDQMKCLLISYAGRL